MQRLVGASVIAEHLGITPGTVRVLARQGLLPALRVGHSWRFDLEEVMAWARSGKANAVNGAVS